MFEEVEHYITIKLVFTILFGEIGEDYKNQEWITDIQFFRCIELVVKLLAENCFLSNDIKEKIYSIMLDSRAIKTDNYNDRVEVINRIIGYTNSQKYDDSDLFYRSELAKRLSDDRYLMPEYDISDAIPIIHDFIAYDFVVLYSQYGKNISTDDFIMNSLNDLSNMSNYYFGSLNAFLDECPEIFQNEQFRIRTGMVLDSIDELYKSRKTRKITKTIRKEMKKSVK